MSIDQMFYFVCFYLKEEEMFRPNMFFLLILPPIIFESGYSLHKVCTIKVMHKIFNLNII